MDLFQKKRQIKGFDQSDIYAVLLLVFEQGYEEGGPRTN